MLSIPTRAISPHSVRCYHLANDIINMSASKNEHRGASSSSVKRKRDHPGDTRPDTKAPKRASTTKTYSQNPQALPFTDSLASRPQSFQSLKSAMREMKRPMRRSPSGGSPLPSVRRAVVYTACTSSRLHLHASRRSISMVPLSNRPMSKSGGGVLVVVVAAAANNTA